MNLPPGTLIGGRGVMTPETRAALNRHRAAEHRLDEECSACRGKGVDRFGFDCITCLGEGTVDE